MLLTAVTFIFVLGILIFIHELGHFLVAKRVGIKVERFSLGFPPDIISRKYGDTTYSIGMIPLGGYVKMAAEHPHEEATGAPYEFMSRTVGERAAVIFAGPHFYQGISAIGMIFVLGLALGGLMVWRKSIVPCVVFHAMFDFIQFSLLQYVAKTWPDT